MSQDRLDSLDMFGAAYGLAEQVERAAQDAAQVDLTVDAAGIQNVVVLGMGGSGIGGDLLAASTGDRLSVPLVIPKGYEAPGFVGPSTLVFAVSFSGNTEETVAAASQAAERGARIIAITAGGELARLGEEWGTAVVPIQDGIPMPRAGIGAVGIPALVVLERIGLIEGVTDQIKGTVEQLRTRRDELIGDDSFAKELARRIGGTMPIVYGGGAVGDVAAMRWKGQFNENAKVPSFANRIPELTHNEICGWGQHGDITRQVFTMLLLRHGYEHPQTSRRFEMVAEICDEVVGSVRHIEASGESRLAQLFDLVLIGDYVSLELAAMTGVDPGPVPILDHLKEALRR